MNLYGDKELPAHQHKHDPFVLALQLNHIASENNHWCM